MLTKKKKRDRERLTEDTKFLFLMCIQKKQQHLFNINLFH